MNPRCLVSKFFKRMTIILLAGDQWWPFFCNIFFLVTEILCLVI